MEKWKIFGLHFNESELVNSSQLHFANEISFEIITKYVVLFTHKELHSISFEPKKYSIYSTLDTCRYGIGIWANGANICWLFDTMTDNDNVGDDDAPAALLSANRPVHILHSSRE